MNTPTQLNRQTDVMEKPFFCMAVLQAILLIVWVPLGEGALPILLFLLSIYLACDIAFAALYAIHYRIRQARPVLSRVTKILVILSPIYLPILVGIAQKHLQ